VDPLLSEAIRNPKLVTRWVRRRILYERRVSSFIAQLTGQDVEKIRSYIGEVSGTAFEKDMRSQLRPYPRLGYATSSHGRILYALCRFLSPRRVVETGVFSGISSSYILLALERNGSGMLHSIDLPDHGLTLLGKEPGFVVPASLRAIWTLQLGSSSTLLEPLLTRLQSIDLFFHDSLHTYENMIFEFQNAWAHLREGGVLLSDNIDDNSSFYDFCRKRGQDLVVHRDLISDYGGCMKQRDPAEDSNPIKVT
jgi:predicted O-methyltransferase YrrM